MIRWCRRNSHPRRAAVIFASHFRPAQPVVLLANRPAGDFSSAGDNAVSGVENIPGQEMSPGVMHAYVYGEFSAPVKIETNSENGRHLVVTATDAREKVLEFRYGFPSSALSRRRKIWRKKFPPGTSTKSRTSPKIGGIKSSARFK